MAKDNKSGVTADSSISSSGSFWKRHFDRRISRAILSVFGFGNPLSVQEKVIPFALKGKDLLIRARTGSGKTIAYAMPVVQRLLESSRGIGSAKKQKSKSCLNAVILVPTKDLCSQVTEVFNGLLRYLKDDISIANCVSLNVEDELSSNILVSTPKYFVGLINRLENRNSFLGREGGGFSVMGQGYQESRVSAILQESLEIVVVDEADLMFSYGYLDDMMKIGKFLPASSLRNYQAIICSATLSDDVNELKSLILHKPTVIHMENEEAEGHLTELYVECNEEDKWLILYSLLKLELIPLKCIIFTKSIIRAHSLSLFLRKFFMPSAVLSPYFPLATRQTIIQTFNQGLVDILIATDEVREVDNGKSLTDGILVSKKSEDESGKVDETGGENPNSKDFDDATGEAHEEGEMEKPSGGKLLNSKLLKRRGLLDEEFSAHRGLDFQSVACVCNFDLPATMKAYTHRIGRTARAGENGVALSLYSPEEISDRKVLKKLLSRDPSGASLSRLQLDVKDIECFRYRVNDVLKEITKKSVVRSTIEVLQKEALQSEKLKSHFEDNPIDRIALKRSLRNLKDSRSGGRVHLQVIPEYLQGEGVALMKMNPTLLAVKSQVSKSSASEGIDFGNKQRQNTYGIAGKFQSSFSSKKTRNDPLKTFEASSRNTGKIPRKYAKGIQTLASGETTLSGRKMWKIRHKKRIGPKNDTKGSFLKKRQLARIKNRGT